MKMRDEDEIAIARMLAREYGIEVAKEFRRLQIVHNGDLMVRGATRTTASRDEIDYQQDLKEVETIHQKAVKQQTRKLNTSQATPPCQEKYLIFLMALDRIDKGDRAKSYYTLITADRQSSKYKSSQQREHYIAQLVHEAEVLQIISRLNQETWKHWREIAEELQWPAQRVREKLKNLQVAKKVVCKIEERARFYKLAAK